MARKKITVVGAGNVGATTAQRPVEKKIGNLVPLGIFPGIVDKILTALQI